VILALARNTPDFTFGVGSVSPGEKILCSMSKDGDFNQLVYILPGEGTPVICTPIDSNSLIAPKTLNYGINDLSEFYQVPVEFKNVNYGTPSDTGSSWLAIKPRPMSDRYSMIELSDGQTVQGDDTIKYIIVAMGKAMANDKMMTALQWAKIQNGMSINLNINPNSKIFLLIKN